MIKELIKKLIDQEINENELDNLRMSCRDESSARELYATKDAFSALLKFDKSVNGLKVLANILYHCQEARCAFGQTKEFTEMLTTDNPFTTSDNQKEIWFVKLRLIFLATIEEVGARKLASLLTSNKHGVLKLGELSNDSLIEILRILYNTTRFMLIPEELDKELLNCLKSAGDNVEIVGNVYNVLLNSQETAFKQSIDHAILLESLACLLNDKEAEKSYIASACMVIKKFVDVNDSVRHDLRKGILPTKFERGQKGITNHDDIKSKLAQCLQHPNEHVSLAVGDLSYSLVNQQVLRLVYHFGYGNVAGYLYSRNLLQPSNVMEQDQALSGISSDEEEIKKGALNGVDLVTGGFADAQPAGADMTEEEKQVESKRLLELFQKLEENGIIKMYTARNQ